MKIYNLIKVLFVILFWSFMFYVIFFDKRNVNTSIKEGETYISWSAEDTLITIKGDTSKAIKLLIKRIDYLQNGPDAMKETYVEPKTFDL